MAICGCRVERYSEKSIKYDNFLKNIWSLPKYNTGRMPCPLHFHRSGCRTLQRARLRLLILIFKRQPIMTVPGRSTAKQSGKVLRWPDIIQASHALAVMQPSYGTGFWAAINSLSHLHSTGRVAAEAITAFCGTHCCSPPAPFSAAHASAGSAGAAGIPVSSPFRLLLSILV